MSSVPWHHDVDVANIGAYPFRIGPVSAVARVIAINSVRLIAQVANHLGHKSALQDTLDQSGQQAALARQFQPVRSGLNHQLVRQIGEFDLARFRRHSQSCRLHIIIHNVNLAGPDRSIEDPG